MGENEIDFRSLRRVTRHFPSWGMSGELVQAAIEALAEAGDGFLHGYMHGIDFTHCSMHYDFNSGSG